MTLESEFGNETSPDSEADPVLNPKASVSAFFGALDAATQAEEPELEQEPQPTESTPRPEPVLAAEEVRKSFPIGDQKLEVLHGVNLELYPGEVLALTGPSGAGKSTLLHILGLLDPPSEGRVMLEGKSAWDLSMSERALMRNQRVGFVFQFYHLLPELNGVENVMLPSMISLGRRAFKKRKDELQHRAESLLKSFGLNHRLGHRPEQLSGGERQRVALARALFHNPPIIIADEPTGNLDSATGEQVLELLFEEQQRRKLSLLLVTHDDRLAARCQRQVHMEDGMVQMDSTVDMPQ